MRNALNTQLEYCEGYTVHSPPIYITRTTVILDTYASSVYICITSTRTIKVITTTLD